MTETPPKGDGTPSKEKSVLSFHINGRKYTYNGFPHTRSKDLFELFIKLSVDEKHLVPTYRANCPEDADKVSDAEIVQQLRAAQQARKEKADRKKRQAAADAEKQKPREVVAEMAKMTSNVSPECPALVVSKPARAEQVERSSPAPTTPPPATIGADAKADLDNYISEVLKHPNGLPGQSIDDLGRLALPPRPHHRTLSQGSLDFHCHSRTPSMETGATAVDTEYIVVLSCRATEIQKLVSVKSQSTTYEDFCAKIEAKLGFAPEALYFDPDDGSGQVQLDDELAFRMFIGACTAERTNRVVWSRVAPDLSPFSPSRTISATGTDLVNDSMGRSATTLANETYIGHSDSVFGCVFHPDGVRFATCSQDRSVRVWSAEQMGKVQAMKGGHNHAVLACDFSPDGNYIVTASEHGTLKLWNASTTAMVHNFKGHEEKAWKCRFNPTSAHVVSCSSDLTVRVWSVETGKSLQVLKGHETPVLTCAFSKSDNGTYVVSGADDKTVRLWHWRDKRNEIRTLRGHAGSVWCAQFSHNDSVVISGAMDGTVLVWNVADGAIVHRLKEHADAVFAVALRGGVMATGSRDTTVIVWHINPDDASQPPRPVRTLTSHTRAVHDVSLHGTRLLSVSQDNTARLWNLESLDLVTTKD